MARFEGGTIVFETTWTAVKDQIDTRKLDFRYEEDATAYQIYAVDENFLYTTVIYKSGQAPQDQSTYDIWRADFEFSYKGLIVDFNNTEPVFISNIDGYSVVLKDGALPTANDGYGIALIGYDGSNYRMTRMDSSGHQILVGAGIAGTPSGGVISIQGVSGGQAMPVSGTVTANQGGAWTVAQSGTWTVQPGNTANTTPWLTTISQGGNSATVTASNALKVDGSAVTQPVSGTVTANAGTGNFTVVQSTASNLRVQLASESTTGTAIPSTAVMAGGSDGTNLRSIFLDSSGRQIIIGAAANGAAVTGNPVLIAGSDGTNARSIRTATDGTVRVDPTGTTTQPVSGTVTANQGGTWNITNISGTVSLPTGAATETSLAKLTQTQGSTTSGQSGPLILGAVTTAAPTYTTGQSSPLSLDTTGALRITGSISASNPSVSNTGATPPASATYIGGSVTTAAPTYTTGQMNALSLDTSGALRVTGSISASNPSVGSNNSAIPTSSNQIGGSDGTNLQAVRVFDLDTGGGTQFILGVGLRKAASGGSVELGTSSDPIKIDPTGTTSQPVVGPGAAGAAISGNPVRIGGSDGTNTRNILTDTSGRQIIVGAATAGAVAAGAPLLLGSVAPTGNMTNVIGGNEGSILISQGPNNTVIHSNATITSSNSVILNTSFYGAQQITLIINIKNSPTGTTPTITYTINEVDPGDQTTVLTNGATASTVSISAVGTYNASIIISTSSCIKISWTVTGSSPSFTGVYATVLSKSTPAVLKTENVCFGSIALSTNSVTKVESTTYTEQTSNATRSMSSNVTSDTAAGLGARTVLITYYDSSGNGPFTTTITLNGTTAVNTSVSDICFIESMVVTTVGAGGANNGTISLFASTGGTGGTIGTIAAFTIRTLWAHHYVALGKTCYITSFSGSLTSTSGTTMNIRAQSIPITNSTDIQVSEFIRTNGSTTGSTTTQVLYNNPIKVVGPSRIRIYTQSDTSVSATHNAAFNFYEQ